MTYKGFEIYAECTVRQTWDITDEGVPDTYLDQSEDAPEVIEFIIYGRNSGTTWWRTLEGAKQFVDGEVAKNAA